MKLKQAFVEASEIEDGEWEYIDTSKIQAWPRYTSKTPIPAHFAGDERIEAEEFLAELGEEGEDLDTENIEIIEISDDKIVLVCGGDWQSPGKVTLGMVNDQLTAVEVELFTDEFRDGFDRDRIVELLNS